MMPSSIQVVASRNKNGYDLLFEKIKKDVSGADIAFANLETPVDDGAGISGYPRFNAHSGLLGALKKTGVTVVSLANNHAMDAGSGGLKRTIRNLEASGLAFIGAGRTKAEAGEIKFVTVRDVRLALLAYTYGTNQRLPKKASSEPGVNVLGFESMDGLNRAAADIRRARTNADLVLVSIHWGDEYALLPTNWQRKVAAELVEAGADIILGHHPHVLQPIESIAASDGRVALVAFSLGNFISSQNAGISYAKLNHRKALTGDSIVLSVVAVKENGKTRVDRAEFLPIWTLREPDGNGVVCRPVSLSREIARLEAKQKRKTGEDELLKFLNFRKDYIVKSMTSRSY